MISFNVQVRDFPFDETSQSRIESWKSNHREYGSNWPVVYLIHNDDTEMPNRGWILLLLQTLHEQSDDEAWLTTANLCVALEAEMTVIV